MKTVVPKTMLHKSVLIVHWTSALPQNTKPNLTTLPQGDVLVVKRSGQATSCLRKVFVETVFQGVYGHENPEILLQGDQLFP